MDELAAQFNVMADRLSGTLRMLEADRDRLREFVADVSHELRTPIAALRMYTELQRDGQIDEVTRAEFLERSTEQIGRLPADGEDPVPAATAPAPQHDGWFVEHDAAADIAHDRVGGAQIDAEVHSWGLPSAGCRASLGPRPCPVQGRCPEGVPTRRARSPPPPAPGRRRPP